MQIYICSCPDSPYCARAFSQTRLHVHIQLDTTHSGGLLWTSDRPDAEISDNTQHSERTDIHAPGGIRTHNPSRHALNRAATGIGSNIYICVCVCVCVSTAHLIQEFCVFLTISYFIKTINQVFFTFETKYYFL